MKLSAILRHILSEDTLRQYLEKFPEMLSAVEDMDNDGYVKKYGLQKVKNALDSEVEIDKNSPVPDLLVKLGDDPLSDALRQSMRKTIHNKFINEVYKSYLDSNLINNIRDNTTLYNFIKKIIKNEGLDISKYSLDSASKVNAIYFFGFLYSDNMPDISNEVEDIANKVVKLATKGNANVSEALFSSISSESGRITFPELIAVLLDVVGVVVDQLGDNYTKEREAMALLSNISNVSRIFNSESDTIKQFKSTIIRVAKNIPDRDEDYDFYVKISSDPVDKMRMSISDYWTSCQFLYKGGLKGRRVQLIGTAHDKFTKIAYLVAKRPYTDVKGTVHPETPFMRVLVRYNDKGDIAFDRVYPSDLDESDPSPNLFQDVLEKHIAKKVIKNAIKGDGVYHHRQFIAPGNDTMKHPKALSFSNNFDVDPY
jgi:hypothetical protein